MISKKQQYRYDLIFDGKIRNGFTQEQVTRLLKEEVKLKDEAIISLFSGKSKICKNADYDTVLKWHKKFFAAGIDLTLKLQTKESSIQKAKDRQIRTMAKIKELPLSSLKPHKQTSRSDQIDNDSLTLESFETIFKQVNTKLKHKIYPLSFILACISVLLTPVLYMSVAIGLLALMFWSVGDIQAYFGKDVSMLASSLIYLIPLLAMGPLVLFMLKPVFARYRQDRAIKLEKDQNELFYGLVRLLCSAMKLKPPERIYVNNHVSMAATKQRLGQINDNSSLVIGLSMFAGLTVDQFVSLLSYELAFLGRRMDLLVYNRLRSIDYWLFQRAWVEDRLDVSLRKHSKQTESFLFKLMIVIAKFYSANIRSIMRFAYKFHHKFSLFVLKPVMSGALLSSAKIVGSSRAKQAIFELQKLRYSEEEIQVFAESLLDSERFLDNLPFSLANFKFQYKVPIEKKIQDESGLSNKWHSYFLGCLNRAPLSNENGFFYCTKKAKNLLPHFELLCAVSTRRYYESLGVSVLAEGFVSDTAIIAAGGDGNEAIKSLGTFFNGLFSHQRILRLDIPKNNEIIKLDHQTLIDRIRWKTLDFKTALIETKNLSQKNILARVGQSLVKEKVKIEAVEYCLRGTDASSIVSSLAFYNHRIKTNQRVLYDMDSLFRQRIGLCINNMSIENQRLVSLHLRTLERMIQFIPLMEKIEQDTEVLSRLLEINAKNGRRKLVEPIRFYTHCVQKDIEQIVGMSKEVRRLETDDVIQSLNEYLVAKLGEVVSKPMDIDALQSVQYSRLLTRSIYQWYVAILMEVTDRCETIEISRSIQPLKLLS